MQLALAHGPRALQLLALAGAAVEGKRCVAAAEVAAPHQKNAANSGSRSPHCNFALWLVVSAAQHTQMHNMSPMSCWLDAAHGAAGRWHLNLSVAAQAAAFAAVCAQTCLQHCYLVLLTLIAAVTPAEWYDCTLGKPTFTP
jgi:hypothetical protein